MDQTSIHYEVPFKYRFLESLYFFLLHMFPNSTRLLNRRRLNSQLAAKNLRSRPPEQRLIPIDRIKDLSFDDFIDRYYDQNLPVIIEQGAKDWPCTQKWSIEYLAKEYPEAELEVLQSAGFVEREYYLKQGDDKPYIQKTVSAKEFHQSIERGEKNYIQFSQLLDIQKDLVKDLNLSWLKKFGKTYFGHGYQSFIGSKHRRTPIHSGMNSFFYIMADGAKQWTLYSAHSVAIIQPTINKRVYNYSDVDIRSPDEESWPGFSQLSHYKFELKKGDILFVPAWMYHEVQNLEDGWGSNYRFNALRPIFRYPTFVFVRLLFSHPNIFAPIYNRSILSGKKDKGSASLV